jgi:hypothetical protein
VSNSRDLDQKQIRAGTGQQHGTQPNKRVHKANTGAKTMTPRELEQLWDLHLAGEFSTKDVEATLATMTDDDVVDHIPVHSGGRGKDALKKGDAKKGDASHFRSVADRVRHDSRRAA